MIILPTISSLYINSRIAVSDKFTRTKSFCFIRLLGFNNKTFCATKVGSNSRDGMSMSQFKEAQHFGGLVCLF